jgi:hypothetical protein
MAVIIWKFITELMMFGKDYRTKGFLKTYFIKQMITEQKRLLNVVMMWKNTEEKNNDS